MDINDIRTSISDNFSSFETHELWEDILQETNPANYGFEVDDVSVDKKDIWVDVPNRTFTFQNLYLSFSVRLGASNDRDGYDEDFQFNLSGSGTFRFDKGSQVIKIERININENKDLELYGESSSRITKRKIS
jgi:hypothetical protein